MDNSLLALQLARLSPLIFIELLNMEISCLFPKIAFCHATLCTVVFLVCLRGRHFGALFINDSTVRRIAEWLRIWVFTLWGAAARCVVADLRPLIFGVASPQGHLRLPEDVRVGAVSSRSMVRSCVRALLMAPNSVRMFYSR